MASSYKENEQDGTYYFGDKVYSLELCRSQLKRYGIAFGPGTPDLKSRA